MFFGMLFLTIVVAVLKLQTLVASQKGLDKQCRLRSDCFWISSLISLFPVCCSDMHFLISSHDHQHFIREQKETKIRNFRTFTIQGSHKLWKSWKTWKITKKSSMHGKVMEFEKNWITMEKSWNFVKLFDKTYSRQKTSCRTHKFSGYWWF